MDVATITNDNNPPNPTIILIQQENVRSSPLYQTPSPPSSIPTTPTSATTSLSILTGTVISQKLNRDIDSSIKLTSQEGSSPTRNGQLNHKATPSTPTTRNKKKRATVTSTTTTTSTTFSSLVKNAKFYLSKKWNKKTLFFLAFSMVATCYILLLVTHFSRRLQQQRKQKSLSNNNSNNNYDDSKGSTSMTPQPIDKYISSSSFTQMEQQHLNLQLQLQEQKRATELAQQELQQQLEKQRLQLEQEFESKRQILEKQELDMKSKIQELETELETKEKSTVERVASLEQQKKLLEQEMESKRRNLLAFRFNGVDNDDALFVDQDEKQAFRTGVSPTEQARLTFVSYVMPATTDEVIAKKLFLIPVYDENSLREASQFAVCVQNYMKDWTLEQQAQITFILYSLNMDRKYMKEMENWKYFDLVTLPMDRIVSNALTAKPSMNKQIVQVYILRHVNKRFRLLKKESELNPLAYVVANKRNLFDLNVIRDELNMNMNQCEGSLVHKKFALVVPFPRVQIPEVMNQLKRWGQHKPCVGKPKLYHEKTDLIFYYHTQRYLRLEEMVLAHLSTNGKVDGPLRADLHCINPVIQFRYTNLLPEEDSYPSSANRMYYRLMFDNTVYTQYRYQFYAEPDTFPIRDGWLTRILDQAYVPDTPWWVSGSIYRGKVAFVNPEGKSADDPSGGDLGSLAMNVHVNGNALYSFSSDFREFMLEMLNDKREYAAYDLGFTQYLFEFGWRKARKVWHHFLFSDYILNLWKTDWTEEKVIWESPNTYLVHSKQKKENPTKKLAITAAAAAK